MPDAISRASPIRVVNVNSSGAVTTGALEAGGNLETLADLLADAVDANGNLKSVGYDAAGNALSTSAEEHIGQLGGHTPRVVQTMVRASDATQYAIGDTIANSTTAASVVPIEFTVARNTTDDLNRSGRLSGCRCSILAASGTIVLPKFNLYLFRPATNIPFAAGSYPADNAAFNISAAAMKELVAVFSFSDVGWLNQAGGATAAGDHIYQSVGLSTRPYAPWNLTGLSSTKLLGLMQAQNTWNPGAVVNTFDFALDVEQD